MLIDAREFKSPQNFSADICIVGAGVAGIVLANELRSINKSIILLEAGGEKYDDNIQQFYSAQSYPENFPDPLGSRIRALGGSCNRWENSTERLDAIDFEKRSWVSDSGWPINYSDLTSYYGIAEDYCSVGSDGYSVGNWEDKGGFENICQESDAWIPSIVKSALPPTRFFDKYRSNISGRPNVRVYSHAAITDLSFDIHGQTVNSVTFQANPYVKHQVKAKIIVFSMGGIESARLLLQFNQKYNDALGNKNDNVGRYFMEHPTIRAAQFYPIGGKALPEAYKGVFDNSRRIRLRLKLNEKTQNNYQCNNLRIFFNPKPRRILSDGISSSHLVFDALTDAEWPDNFGQHLSNILGDIDLLADSVSRNVFDKRLFQSSDDITGYQIISMIEQTPNRDNRIMLGDEKDPFGNQRVKIKWHLSESDKKKAWKSLELLSKDAGLSAWGRVKLLPERSNRIWGSQLGFGQHHIGTTKMGTSMQNGVVDQDCRVFGTKNLYMAGSSVFPTGGHVPPTLTIAALAVRLADTIKRAVASK